MPLTVAKGNMYKDITNTWNPVKGRCPHSCDYCWMKTKWDFLEEKHGWPKEQFIVEKELNANLGMGNFIFVCSATDMWAEVVPAEWIWKVLGKCDNNPNRYLLQSKNPERFFEFEMDLDNEKYVFCTTIESNIDHPVSKAPNMEKRTEPIRMLRETCHFETAITIEPILEFDIEEFVDLVATARPNWVWIGADSQRCGLPEPSKEDVEELVRRLELFTEVRMKHNLWRLLK